MSSRSRPRTAATSKMERFVIVAKGWKPLTVVTKCSVLYVAAVLDPPAHLRLLMKILILNKFY